MEQLLCANKHSQKNIKASNAKNCRLVGGKDLLIPIRNLILLHDHLEGQNKIQDHNKDQLYVVTGHHEHQNAYFAKPIGSESPLKQVNRHEMFDLGITYAQEQEHKEQKE